MTDNKSVQDDTLPFITFDALRELLSYIEQHMPEHPQRFEVTRHIDETSFLPYAAILIRDLTVDEDE